MRWFLASFAALCLLMAAVPEAAAQAGTSCHGVIRIFYRADGTVRRMKLICSGECPDGQECRRDRSGNHHGGLREWCDCDRDGIEPPTCHTVLNTPGAGEGGGPPSVLCASPCPDPTDECLPVVLQQFPLHNGGLVEDVTCECL